MDLPVLGIGLTYFSRLEPLLATHGDLVDVLRALAEGRLPDPDLVRPGSFEIEVTPDDVAESDAAALTAPQVLH